MQMKKDWLKHLENALDEIADETTDPKIAARWALQSGSVLIAQVILDEFGYLLCPAAVDQITELWRLWDREIPELSEGSKSTPG